jgi:hypothetical protein
LTVFVRVAFIFLHLDIHFAVFGAVLRLDEVRRGEGTGSAAEYFKVNKREF